MYSISIVISVCHKKAIVWSFAGVIEAHTIIISSPPFRNNWAFIDSHYMVMRLQIIIIHNRRNSKGRVRCSWEILLILSYVHIFFLFPSPSFTAMPFRRFLTNIDSLTQIEDGNKYFIGISHNFFGNWQSPSFPILYYIRQIKILMKYWYFSQKPVIFLICNQRLKEENHLNWMIKNDDKTEETKFNGNIVVILDFIEKSFL